MQEMNSDKIKYLNEVITELEEKKEVSLESFLSACDLALGVFYDENNEGKKYVGLFQFSRLVSLKYGFIDKSTLDRLNELKFCNSDVRFSSINFVWKEDFDLAFYVDCASFLLKEKSESKFNNLNLKVLSLGTPVSVLLKYICKSNENKEPSDPQDGVITKNPFSSNMDRISKFLVGVYELCLIRDATYKDVLSQLDVFLDENTKIRKANALEFIAAQVQVLREKFCLIKKDDKTENFFVLETTLLLLKLKCFNMASIQLTNGLNFIGLNFRFT